MSKNLQSFVDAKFALFGMISRMDPGAEKTAICSAIEAGQKMLDALKDAHPFIVDDGVRARVGGLIVKAERRQ